MRRTDMVLRVCWPLLILCAVLQVFAGRTEFAALTAVQAVLAFVSHRLIVANTRRKNKP